MECSSRSLLRNCCLVAASFLILNLDVTPATAAVSDNSAAISKRLAWNKETLVGAYQKVGHKSPAWDTPATGALNDTATLRATQPSDVEPLRKAIVRQCDEAVRAGCKDPMIGYLRTRFDVAYRDISEPELTRAFVTAADNLIPSKYPDIRKVYASIRAAQQLKSQGTNATTLMHHYRRAAMRSVTNVVADKNVPVEEIDDVCSEFLTLLENNATQLERFYYSIETPLFQNWTNDYRSWLVKGRFYIQHAWHARGIGLANTVSDEGWKLFRERLALAADALERSWELNPHDARIPTHMLTVELGQGKGRHRMDLWFLRAMEIDTNNFQACVQKYNYLLPKWYGSPEDVLQFGRQCVKSPVWGGRVPLVLVDVHDSLAVFDGDKKRYWKNPEVWTDAKAAYEKFFTLNPEATSWRHNYARHAWWAEQWDDLNKQIPLLGPINYEYFGGKSEFEKMLAEGKQHASTATTKNLTNDPTK